MLLLCGGIGVGLVHAGKGICLECIVSCAVVVCIVSLGVVGESLFSCQLKN